MNSTITKVAVSHSYRVLGVSKFLNKHRASLLAVVQLRLEVEDAEALALAAIKRSVKTRRLIERAERKQKHSKWVEKQGMCARFWTHSVNSAESRDVTDRALCRCSFPGKNRDDVSSFDRSRLS